MRPKLKLVKQSTLVLHLSLKRSKRICDLKDGLFPGRGLCLMVRQCHVSKTTVAGVRHCAFVISISWDSVLPFLCVCSMSIDVQVWGRYICTRVCMCVEATHRSVPSFFSIHALLSETLLLYNEDSINLSRLPIQWASGSILFHLQNTGRLSVPLLSSFLLGIHNQVLKTNTSSTESSTHARDQLFLHTTDIAPA